MPKYTQTVQFQREFVIHAKNATEANDMLENEVNRVEFDSDLSAEGYYEFEDEPVECPKCKGQCEIEGQACNRCNGDGCVPFGTTDN